MNNREQNIPTVESQSLSFFIEFELSRSGMIKEIETEFDIIQFCLVQMDKLEKSYLPMFSRILVMPLRKLICEKESVLLKIEPSLKLSPIRGEIIELDGKLKVIRPNLSVAPQSEWIPVEQWLKENIAWFDKTVNDLPDTISSLEFKKISDKLKGSDKATFKAMFKEVIRSDTATNVYTRVDPSDETKNAKIFSLLKKIGYYDQSVYNFLKHLSDKRGAHIDIGYSLVVDALNSPIIGGLTPVLCIALQIIWAVKQQVPELNNYWPGMEIPEE